MSKKKGQKKPHLLKKRRDKELSKDQAANLNFKAKHMYNEISGNEKLLSEVFGSEWWYSLPEKLNPEYEYICRIISTVKKQSRKSNGFPDGG